MKKIHKICAFAAAAVMLLSLSACGASQDGARNAGQELVFAASTATGSFYQYCVPCCELVSKYSDDVALTAISTTGTKESFDMLEAGSVQVAGGPGITEYYAYKGLGAWAGTGAVNFSIAYAGYPDYVQIAVPASSPIKSVADLSGKRVNLFQKDGTANITADIIFAALGISNCQPFYLDGTDGLNALKDGSIDAMFYCGGLGPSMLLELSASSGGMRLIPFTADEAAAIETASEGVLKLRTIPAGYYAGTENEVLTVGSSVPIAVSNDVPEETVYQMVKILEEHHDELKDAVSSAEYSSAANTVADWGGGVIPLHPGAARYFRELGLME